MENVLHRYLEERKQSAEVKIARLRNPVPPPLEPEVGSNLLNLHIYSDFLLFLLIENVTICLFYDIYQILSCTIILITIFFSLGCIQNPFQFLRAR